MTDQHRAYFERHKITGVFGDPPQYVFTPDAIFKAQQPVKGWFRSFFWAKLLGRKMVVEDSGHTMTAYRYRDHIYVTEFAGPGSAVSRQNREPLATLDKNVPGSASR